MEFFLCVVGMVLVMEGLPYFTFPDKMKAMMSYVQKQDDNTLRLLGGTIMCLGLVIILIARHGLGY